MSKQLLCFIIENNKLFLDRILVSFNDTPILFICQDERKNYYLVQCSSLENLEYIVEKQNIENLLMLLTKQKSLRSTLLDCDYFWEVKAGNDIKENIVTRKNIAEIDYLILPAEDVFYDKTIN